MRPTRCCAGARADAEPPRPVPPLPKTCLDAARGARAALRRYREAAAAAPPPPGPVRLRVTLPLPSPSERGSARTAIAAFDEGDWPGGIRQKFRALRPLVEAMLDGYAPRFEGMLESPADGLGVWAAADGALTAVTLPSNATIKPFLRLAEGDFGARVLAPGHALLAVNGAWTRSVDVGQLWEGGLRARAAKLIDDDDAWTTLFCWEDARTPRGGTGLLVREWPGGWRLYATSAEGEDAAEGGAAAGARLLLEGAARPARGAAVAALDAAAAEARAARKGGGGGGWWGGL